MSQLFSIKSIVAFFCCLCITGQLQGQPKNQHIFQIKKWEFIREDLGGVWEAVRPGKPGSPEAVPIWKKVTLPHTYNAEDAVDPDKNYYEGPAWYRTTISVDDPFNNGRILLHFMGAGQKSQVYVYTQKVGEHVGGYDEWTLDITDAVKRFKNKKAADRFNGQIPIEVRTDNSRDLQMIPSDMVDFTIYGGLYRPVELVYVPKISLDTFHITPTVDADGSNGKVAISASLRNPSDIKKARFSLAIKDSSGKVVKRVNKRINSWEGMQDVMDYSVSQPALWSPQHPALYTITARLKTSSDTQQITENFGFRHFRFAEHGPFYLNGERLLLQGTHRHADFAGVGAAETKDMIRAEFKLMKKMGVNFIRMGHYQQQEYVLDLADSLGILAWEEIPWNRGGLGGERYQQQAKNMLANMINQHYNHPAIIIWGLGNENDWPGDFQHFNKQKIRGFMSELNDLAHRLDDSRKTAIRRCDFCKDIVDVYSPSIWAGWYSGRYTEYKRSSKKQMEKVDHFFHAEWGGDSHARRHAEHPYKNLGGIPAGQGTAEKEGDAALTGGNARASKDGDWSETYICDLIDWHLKEQETMPWLTGSAQWIFKDFATPLRPNNPIPYVNEKGVVTRDLVPKESYYVFQSYWTDQPMAHIHGHTWPVRWGDEGEKEMIKVYSNCQKMELFVNGKSYGVKKRDSQNFPAAGLRWEVPMRKGKYDVKVIAQANNKMVSDSISFRYQTQQWGKPAKLELEKIARKNDTTTVQVKLLDEHGVLCLDAQNIVRFGLTGDGDLIDNLGTSTGSQKVEMYNGRAIIRVKNNEGNSAVSVRSDGFSTAFLNINANKNE